jgi:hypothetical protein
VASSFQCPDGTGHVKDDERADGLNPHQQCPLLVVGNAPLGRGLRGHLRLPLARGPQVATSGKAARAARLLVLGRKERREKLEKLKVPAKRNLYTLRNFYKRN